MSGQCALDSGNAIQSTPSHFCSNLTGLFVLLDPISTLGYLIARMVRPIPYLNLGSTWMLSRNYEGTGAWKKRRKMPSDISLHRFCGCWTGCYCCGILFRVLAKKKTRSDNVCRLAYFLGLSALYTLQTLRLSKYVHSAP